MIGFLGVISNWFQAWNENRFPDEEIETFLKGFGYVELTYRTNENSSRQPIPMTINGTSDRDQVSLDDRFQVMSWFRLPGQVNQGRDIENNDWSFGFQQSPVQKAGIRWVVAWRVELGEQFIFDLLSDIPGSLSVDGYKIASINRGLLSSDFDHESIYRTELGETVYEKHRFTWNMVVINLPLEYIPSSVCEARTVCCEESYLSESGDCLIQE